jgi:hypothetical protein
MTESANLSDIRRPVEFTIDGRPHETTERRQTAADLLQLAGLNPALYDLGELRGHGQQPVRYSGTEIVNIHQGERFVSIRERADVA